MMIKRMKCKQTFRDINNKLNSMRWFSHRRRTGGRHNCTTPPCSHEMGPSAAAARCLHLQRAHTVRYAPGGVCSSMRVFLSQVTLTFDLWPRRSNSGDIFTVYLTAKFCRPTFSRSEVIVRTKKETHTHTHTDKQTDAAENIHLASLRYAVG